MKPLLFTKLREVKSPNRANSGDAGIDFYIPKINFHDLMAVGQTENKMGINLKLYEAGKLILVKNEVGNDEYTKIGIKPGARILIPSGIRVLIDPKDSMLMAANKSGVATQTGLVYTAEIVDSPYTGEVHIGILNTTDEVVVIDLIVNCKIMQFIHVPVILSTPVEITTEQYEGLAKDWGTRGSAGFGSSDNK